MEDPESQHYFERRAEEERSAAKSATDDRAAQTHRELAEHYEEMAKRGPAPGTAEEPPPQHPGTLPREFRILP